MRPFRSHPGRWGERLCPIAGSLDVPDWLPLVRTAVWGCVKGRRLRHFCPAASKRSKSLHTDTACLHNGPAHCVSLDVPCALTRFRFVFAPQSRIFSAPVSLASSACPSHCTLPVATPRIVRASCEHPGGGPHFHLHEMMVAAVVGASLGARGCHQLAAACLATTARWGANAIAAIMARAASLQSDLRMAQMHSRNPADRRREMLTSSLDFLMANNCLKSSVPIVSVVI